MNWWDILKLAVAFKRLLDAKSKTEKILAKARVIKAAPKITPELRAALLEWLGEGGQ